MRTHSKEELEEALKSISSTLAKCEKALLGQREGTSQHTLLVRRIKAFKISIEFITDALEK